MSSADINVQTQIEYGDEPCDEINQAEVRGTETPRGPWSGLVSDAPRCTTSVVNGLSQQLIHQVNLIIPDILVSFDDLDVELGDAAWPFLQLPAKQALGRAIQNRGETLKVNSAYRTLAQQFLLKKWVGSCGITRAADVGTSNHQGGLALDIEDYDGWKPYLEKHGWNWYGLGDHSHFDYQEERDIKNTAILAFQKLWNKNHSDDKIDEDSEYGPATEARLKQSPVDGFSIAPWDDQPRVLRLSRPMMQGSDVRKVQEALKKAGFALEPDGFFGKDTDAVVKQFQQKNSLKSDGIIGPETRKKLLS